MLFDAMHRCIATIYVIAREGSKSTRMGNDVEFLSKPLIEFQNNPETLKM